MLSKKFAEVDQTRCVACGACENVCPRDAIHVFRGCWSKVVAEQCVGCGKCARVCPTCCIEVKEREHNEKA